VAPNLQRILIWCHIIVLNVHAPTEDKTDDVKDGTCDR
jgi:hypothetical protein